VVLVVPSLTRAAALAVCVALLAGCKVDADVTVTLEDDGTGVISTVITLDAEAVGRVETNGRTLDTSFPLQDLAAAGWEITPWARGADGSAALRLEHDYAGEDELQQRVEELVGPTQLLRDARLQRDRGLFRSHDELTLSADLRNPGTGIQQDPELLAALQGSGLDVATLDQQLQAELREALSVSLTVVAPGGKEETVELLAGESETATAARSRFDSGRLVWFAIAGMLAFLGALLYLAASVGARHERSRRPLGEPDRTPLM
jgi:hypothetical protein